MQTWVVRIGEESMVTPESRLLLSAPILVSQRIDSETEIKIVSPPL